MQLSKEDHITLEIINCDEKKYYLAYFCYILAQCSHKQQLN
jgi:hypothetical protein